MDWPDRFVEALAASANVSAAARLAGIHRDSAYKLRAADPAFAARWDDALSEACDALEAEARRRAMGWDEPYYFEGAEAGSRFKYSDPLMQFLLTAHRPGTYGRNRVEHSGDVTIRVEYADVEDADGDAAEAAPGPDGDPPRG